jgi:hypothetical protein
LIATQVYGAAPIERDTSPVTGNAEGEALIYFMNATGIFPPSTERHIQPRYPQPQDRGEDEGESER